MLTSSALTGSSQTSRSGSRTSARDPDPLPLAAGELVRVAPGVVRLEPDQVHHAGHLGPRAPAASRCRGCAAPPRWRWRWASAGRARRTGPGTRSASGAGSASGRALEVGDVVAVEHDPAAGRLDEPQEGPPDGRLAAARLPDQAERLPARISKLTSSTAFTSPTLRWRRPPRRGRTPTGSRPGRGAVRRRGRGHCTAGSRDGRAIGVVVDPAPHVVATRGRLATGRSSG